MAAPPKTVTDIADVIAHDHWRMGILRTVAALELPDWAIGAGFVRAAVWDSLSNKRVRTPLPDIDVLYFDRENTLPARDLELEIMLAEAGPGMPWSVKNQARMHTRNTDSPYCNTTDALSYWLETATCVAARLNEQGCVSILAPLGIKDLLEFRVRPTASARTKMDQYRARMAAKNWAGSWPHLIVEEI